MADSAENWQVWAAQLAAGDGEVVADFWRRYGRRLELLATRHMTSPLCRREGPDDVVQSVCRTFFRRARNGEFDLPDQECLWRLLCAITLTKIHEKSRFHCRQKRHLDREREAAPDDDARSAIDGLIAHDPSPEEVVMFADQLERLLACFPSDRRAIVELKLQQYTNEEIAQLVHCSEHTVRRVLKRIQKRLKDVLLESLS